MNKFWLINSLYGRGNSYDVADYGAVGDGETDNYNIIQDLIDNNPGAIIHIGKSQDEVFLVSSPLLLTGGVRITGLGEVLLKGATTKLLTSDVSIGDTGVSFDNSDGSFKVGQYAMVWDDNSPTQGGGGTRQVGKAALITEATSGGVSFGLAGTTAFTTAANAKITHCNSAFIIASRGASVSGISINGNSDNHEDLQPVNWHNIDENTYCGTGIVVYDYDDAIIRNTLVKNTILHGVTMRETNGSRVINLQVQNVHDKALLARGWTNTSGNSATLNSSHEDGCSLYGGGNLNISFDSLTTVNCGRHGLLLNSGSENTYIANYTSIENRSPIFCQAEPINSRLGVVNISGTATVQSNLITLTDTLGFTIDDLTIDDVQSFTRIFNITGSTSDVLVKKVTVTNVPLGYFFTGNPSTQQNIEIQNINVSGVDRLFDISTTGDRNNIIFRSFTFTDYNTIGNVGNDRCRFIDYVGGTFLTEAQSTATIKSGRSSIVINHGLNITPLLEDINVEETSAGGTGWFVDQITSTGFTINIPSVAVSNVTFHWDIGGPDAPAIPEPNWSDAYVSDFSAGVDGWTGTRAILSGNQDGIGGKDDCLKFYASADNNTHQINKAAVSVGNYNRVSFEVFIPSGQSVVNGVRLLVNGSTVAYNVTEILDEWIRVTTDEFLASSATISFYLRGTSGTSFAGANSPDDDRAFIKNVVVEYRVP